MTDKAAQERVHFVIEDALDVSTVRHARKLATLRSEKPMAWEDFKKTLLTDKDVGNEKDR